MRLTNSDVVADSRLVIRKELMHVGRRVFWGCGIDFAMIGYSDDRGSVWERFEPRFSRT